MARAKIDWQHHLTQFRASDQSAADYCTQASLNLGSFRHHIYKTTSKRRQVKRFQEFAVTTELVIAKDPKGGLSLSGFDLAQLPHLVGAWSNALS